LQRRVLRSGAQNVVGFRVLVLAKKGLWFRAQNVLGFKVLVLAKKGIMV
jgi:hypothetical protein